MTNIDLHDIPEDRIKQFERHVDISVYYKTSDSLSFRGGEIDYHGNDHYDTLFTATIQWIAPELDPQAALDMVLAKVPYETDEELYLELLLWAEEVEYDKEKFREKIHTKYPPSNNQIVHTIETPKGTIAVEDKQDSIYPGVYILINGEQVAMTEYDSVDEQHAIRVWNKDYSEDSAEYVQFIPSDFPKAEDIPIKKGKTYRFKKLPDTKKILHGKKVESIDGEMLVRLLEKAGEFDAGTELSVFPYCLEEVEE